MGIRLVLLDLLVGKLPINSQTAESALHSSGKPALERTFDYLLALSIASWAVLGLRASAEPVTLVRAATSLLHLSVALAVARRAAVTRLGFSKGR